MPDERWMLRVREYIHTHTYRGIAKSEGLCPRLFHDKLPNLKTTTSSDTSRFVRCEILLTRCIVFHNRRVLYRCRRVSSEHRRNYCIPCFISWFVAFIIALFIFYTEMAGMSCKFHFELQRLWRWRRGYCCNFLNLLRSDSFYKNKKRFIY